MIYIVYSIEQSKSFFALCRHCGVRGTTALTGWRGNPCKRQPTAPTSEGMLSWAYKDEMKFIFG